MSGEFSNNMNNTAELVRLNEELEQRTQLLTTLLDVSNLISSTMELKPLLEAMLDRLKTIIDYKGAKIFAVEGDYLRVIAHRSILTPEQEDKYVFHVNNIPMGAEIIEHRRPVVISDVHENSEPANSFREAMGEFFGIVFKDVRSWMGIPLVIKDRVIGAMTVEHDIPNFYLPQHISLGMTFANQAAIEYENVRLYNETIKRTDELKTMLAVQQAITSRLDKDAVLQMIADEARRLTKSERTAVFLVDGKELVLSVFSGKDSTKFLGYRMSMEKSFLGRSLMDKKVIKSNNAAENREAYAGLVEKAGIKSFLNVPLIAGLKLIGSIVAVDKINGGFGEEDERALSMLASSAVIGLENARLYEEEQRRNLEDRQRRAVAEGLRDILAVLNSNRSLKDILDYIIEQALSLLGTDAGALYRLQGDKGILTIEAARGLPDEYVAGMTVPVGMGVVGQAVTKRRAIIVQDMVKTISDDIFENPAMKPLLAWLAQNYRSLLAVPLICKDDVYGGIVLYYRSPREFSREEVELATTFADQAALVIDNANLRSKAEEIAVAAERSRIARDLHDAVTQTLFSSSLIAEVIPKIWDRNPQEGRKRLEELKELTKGALAEMRTLLLELRPSTLMESGLKELLTQLAQAVTGRARVPVALNIQGQPVLPAEVKIAVYRIAQEALNNISKHSGATEANLELLIINDDNGHTAGIEMQIRDNGRGFIADKVTGEHLGLGIMRERAQEIDAELKIESCIGEGTVIRLKWKKPGERKKNDE
ncbi:MAG: GAF domain-containing protein [Clostridia bacterium]|nr:GAF domain-containing protein [Clostridia bacterium]